MVKVKSYYKLGSNSFFGPKNTISPGTWTSKERACGMRDLKPFGSHLVVLASACRRCESVSRLSQAPRQHCPRPGADGMLQTPPPPDCEGSREGGGSGTRPGKHQTALTVTVLRH